MSIEKLLERLCEAIEADVKSRNDALAAYTNAEAAKNGTKADEGKSKSKSKAKSNDEDEDEEEDDEPKAAKGKGKKGKPAKAAKGKGKKKPDPEDDDEDEDDEEEESDDEDEDDEDDEEEEKTPIKIGDIRDVLVELKEVTGKKGAAKEVLKEFGYDELGDADPREFKALLKAAETALAKAKKKK